MRRLLFALLCTAMLAATFGVANARGRFQVRCMSSHVATVDPIVAPGMPSAHQHEFFGNRTTNADSTYASMLGKPTTCSTPDDTAGYWTPTVFVDGRMVRATSMLVYYRNPRSGAQVRAFPRDLRIVSDSMRVGGRNGDKLLVGFPSCWDGFRLDSPDHRSHMSGLRDGKVCPASHPVQLPHITEVFRYPMRISGGRLSSGDFSTGHADFWNTWDQPALMALVDRCLNADIICPRID